MKIRIEIPKERGGKFRVAASTLRNADAYQITTTEEGRTTHCGEFEVVTDKLFVVFLFAGILNTAKYFVNGMECSGDDVYDILKRELLDGGNGMYQFVASIDHKNGITACYVGREKTGDELLQEIRGMS
jgi:hypothetical protein